MAGWILLAVVGQISAAPIRVVVWDEQQPSQKPTYENFLGNAIADHLAKKPGFQVKSVRLNDPEQGVSNEVLDQCDVLIWWGHQRHRELTPEHTKAIVQRIKEGRLSLLALHSAHWSEPFIAAMKERTIADALKTVPKSERAKVKVIQIPPTLSGLTERGAPVNPSFRRFKNPEGVDTLEIKLPSCVFPAVRNEGKPSHIKTLLPKHPIAKGIPLAFDIPQTEMYDEPFTVPTPDEVVFEEHWDAGEHFRSGCSWQVGKGKVFYFRPGHETYPIFKQEIPLKIVENAVLWLGRR
jgi:trehalose utilization protein